MDESHEGHLSTLLPKWNLKNAGKFCISLIYFYLVKNLTLGSIYCHWMVQEDIFPSPQK